MIRFINPNYHVILIHYPLALLGLGLFIELFGFLWPAGTLRAAGRWMLLLGALAVVPAATSGIFAKYDIMQQLAGGEGNWRDVRDSAGLSALQWQFLNRHVLLSAIAATLAALTAIAWLASSPQWPSAPGPAILALFVASMGLMTFGAYNAGEIVYRTQFGTQSQAQSDKLQHEWDVKTNRARPNEKLARELDYYVDTLQAHVIIAGFVFSLAAAALGLSFKRARQMDVKPAGDPPKAAPPPDAPAAPLWLGTALAAALAAAMGWYVFAHDLPNSIWNVVAIFHTQILEPLHEGNARTFAHLLLGAIIIGLAALLIPMAHWGIGGKGLITLVGCVMLLAIAAQIGVGMLMLYDTDTGPLAHFNAAMPAAADN